MKMSFKPSDVARVLVGVDASDEPRATPGKRKKARWTRRDPGAMRSSPLANDMHPVSLLLAIPAEIRLQLYDLLLVSRLSPKQYSSWMVGKTRQQKIALYPHAPKFGTLDLAILRTCKKIYHEATPMLYGRNVFSFTDPERMLQLMSQMGPTNVKLLRTLDVWVPWRTNLSAWLSLLRAFARDAIGLQSVDIIFATNCYFPGSFERGREERTR